MTSPGRTVEQLARAAHARPEPMAALLAEEVQRGILARLPDGSYRLSEQTERDFGPALRQLAGWREP
jgi:uncharacterized protein with von Willebrand factor type A (vWA) domain